MTFLPFCAQIETSEDNNEALPTRQDSTRASEPEEQENVMWETQQDLVKINEPNELTPSTADDGPAEEIIRASVRGEQIQ
jgi:hypothetical protein